MLVTGNNLNLQDKSIRIAEDGLSLYLNGTSKEFPFIKKDSSFQHTMAILLCDADFAKMAQSPFSILLESPLSVVVPRQIFKEKEEQELFKFQFPEWDAHQMILLSEEIPSFDLCHLFAIPSTLYQFFHQTYPLGQWHHPHTETLVQALQASKEKAEKQVWIHSFKRFFSLTLVENGKLLFSNHYKCGTANDILYYVANLFEQFELSQQDTPLYGICDPNEWEVISRHILNSYFVEPHANH